MHAHSLSNWQLPRPIAGQAKCQAPACVPAPCIHTRSSRRLCRLAASSPSSSPQPDDVQLGQPVPLPEELQGLSINNQGLLVDEKTGKVVNSLGATRFDVAVSAMRGLLDPPAWVENTEHTPGLILGSLVQFPTRYCFSVVGENSPEFKDYVVSTVAKLCETQVDPQADVKATQRLSGKFLSLQVDAMVRAPEIVGRVLDELGKDKRVKMKY